MPRPPWGALGGQRHRLSLPASAPAGDPNCGPLIATGRKFPELLPGERGATCLGHTLLLEFSRLVSRGQCLWPLGRDPGATTASQDPYLRGRPSVLN